MGRMKSKFKLTKQNKFTFDIYFIQTSIQIKSIVIDPEQPDTYFSIYLLSELVFYGTTSIFNTHKSCEIRVHPFESFVIVLDIKSKGYQKPDSVYLDLNI